MKQAIKDKSSGNRSFFSFVLYFLKNRILYPFCKPSEGKLQQLQKKIAYRFKEIRLLKTALKHRSYTHASGEEAVESNERLEFLGDAVLGLIVGEYLYERFPHRREGELSQLKSHLVSKAVLSEKAAEIGLDGYLFLSGPEVLSNSEGRASIITDAFEALIGAIYLDGGLDAARRFLRRQLLSASGNFTLPRKHPNFKSMLLEYSQAKGKGSPHYVLKAQEGPDHQKLFTVEVFIQRESLGRGKGHNKKEAEQAAAREALEKLGILRKDQRPDEEDLEDFSE
ncbi:MAG: ribonuclease III [Candidatus Latescibacteria bacterium]|nr:ribonuclease III [Candidatus Latescibacterota bacterium]